MKRQLRKNLALLLSLAMLLTFFPAAASAADEDAVYTKVTELSDLTDGQYVLVADTLVGAKALGTNISSKIDGTDVTITTEGSLSSSSSIPTWTVTVSGEKATFHNGSNYLGYGSSGTNFTKPDEAYDWNITSNDNGTFRFTASGAETRAIAWQEANERFGAYSTTNSDGYVFDLLVFKAEGGGSTTDPGGDPDPQPGEPPIKAGDEVVFYMPDQQMAMSTTASGSKLAGQEATLENSILATAKDTAVFTVEANEEGQFTFSAGGKYLTSGETGNSLTMAETASEYSYWTLEEQGEGWLVKNVSAQFNGSAQYIEYYGGFTTYGYDSGNAGIYTFQFFLANDVKEPGSTPDPDPEGAELVETPANGDIVVIYYPTDGKVMGTESYTYNEKKDELVAVDGTLTDGLLTVPEGAAEFKVYVDENGHYTFESDAGYLYLDGTNVRLVEEQGDYTLFDLEKQETGSFIKSTNAQFSGKAQYLEYYGGYFTCYGMGSNTDIYTFQFYKTGTFNPSTGPIVGGDHVVIYNPGSGMALSANAKGTYYRAGVAFDPVTSVNSLTGDLVWDVSVNADGNYLFSNNGQKLSVNANNNSLPLDEVNDTWKIEAATTEGCYYLINVNRPNLYVEWFSQYSEFSTYNYSASNESIYAMQLIKVDYDGSEPGGEVEFPDVPFVIHNISSQGVLAGQDSNTTSPSVNNASATLAAGAVTPANGARVFTVETTSDGYYRFKNEHDGYLSSNGTGSNAFYQAVATEDSDWTVTAYNGGYKLMSRVAKYNGKYDQYLEYYSGSYKTYSLYDSRPGDDKDIYTFQFYPVAEGVKITEGVVNIPGVTFGFLSDAYVGQDYTVSFTVDSVFGVADSLTAKYGETEAVLTEKDGTYSFTIPASALTEGGKLAVTVSGTDTKGVAISGFAEITVKDEPYILDVFPAVNDQTGDDKRPEIGFTFGNAGDKPTITLKVNDQDVTTTVDGSKVSYKPTADMADGKVTVTATVTRGDGKSATRTWTFTIGTAQYQLYFGQLHSHTKEYSDGAGTLDEGLAYVAGLPESANVDFVAFTDHSNYFDSTSSANPEAALYDVTQMTEESKAKWDTYTGKVAAFNETYAGEIVALAGFEMTWSGGPGHINTFNTPGIVSRNNKTLNDKTADAGMKAYYALLSNENLVDSISQFNHPGTTFGNFSDFAYYDPIIDTRMYLVEVGNGEGAIGAGGYYPSYEQYIMALDKGWHLAPTNNQDNHKGSWGNANDARDVVLTDDFSQEGIYEAIRNYRVYATEDKNLEIHYTLNGQMLGSTIKEAETANIQVSVYDPDPSDSISKVEVVVNSGKVAYTWEDPAELSSGQLECTIPADYSYYFIRVTQGDGDLAVTAPVWIGEVVKLGVSSVECGTATPVTGEALTLTTTLFNSEASEATVKSITYTSGDETLGTDNTVRTLPASGTLAVDWSYLPTMARVMTITATAVIAQGDIEYSYSKSVTLDILDASKLVYIGIDASHYNEYVSGNYKDSMGNFSNLAAGYSVRTVELKTSEDLIAACENESGKYVAILLTAPSRRLAEAQSNPKTYSDAELAALTAFNAAGGTVIVTGWADVYENYAAITGNPDILHMAATQNELLAALGSSLRIADDTTSDDKLNGGDSNRRLYLSTYNFDSFLMDGVEFDPDNPNNNMYSQLYSNYGGASVYAVDADGEALSTLPATVSPVVYGHASTFSSDNDGDGVGASSVPKYTYTEGDNRLMVLATEDLGDDKGLIIVAGAAFMSNFEVQSQPDSAAEKNYSNYTICENLVNYLNPITVSKIADVQDQPLEGIKYVVEGVVTSNASGFDKDTAFFDCIYVQDDTAGINAFPVSGEYKIGDKVRITGTTSSYQGERQLNVTSIEKIGEVEPLAPKLITTKEAAQSTYLGSLVKIQGVVVSFAEAQGSIQTIMVRDETGYDARVFIDGYITQNKEIKNLAVGHEITVIGLSSYDNSFDGPAPRIRVRDRAEIVCGTEVVDIPPEHVDYYPPYTPPKDDVVIIDENGVPLTPVPPADAGAYTVAVQVDKDGHYTIVPIAVVENGKILSLGDSSKLQLIDNTKVFVDVAASLWYSPAVAFVSARELLLGTGGGYFAPDASVTGGELVTVLWRLAGCPAVEGQAGTEWYAQAALWAASKSIISNDFDGSQTATRADVAKALYAMAGALNAKTDVSGSLSGFTDVAAIPEDAMEAFLYCQNSGIITGRPDNQLAPNASLTRGELSVMVQRFILSLLK